MPWQKFEALYDAHIKREAVDSITNIRNAQISGLWANTNLDPQKEGENPRSEILKDVYDSYVKSVKMIYNQFDEDKVRKEDSSQIDWDDPFFKRMKIPSNPNYDPTTDRIISPEPHDHNRKINIDQDRTGDSP